VNEKPDTATHSILASNPKLSFERFHWVTSLHIPHFFKQALPRPFLNTLRELRRLILTRNVPGHTLFEQSLEDAAASAFLSIIVPIHDSPEVTRRCLVSLEKYAPKAEIVLIDDGSRLVKTRNLILDFVRRNAWKSVHHDKPLGHSVACEVGAKLANRPYLCLLNSDTVVTPWCWRLVNEVFEQDQSIAVAGPSTSFAGTSQMLPLPSYLRSNWNEGQICEFAKLLAIERPRPIVEDLTWVSGFAFFIRRSLWEQLDGFDRSLPDYGNERELCKRVAAKGFRRVWVRNAYIHHLGQESYNAAIGDEAVHARIRAARIYIRQKHGSSDL